MPIPKSFVLSSAFPSSKTSFEALKKAVDYIKPYDFSMVEYYCEKCSADSVRKLLGEHQSIFLAAALQKTQGLNLCSPITDNRKRSVEALAECFLFAQQAGAKSVLINSGSRPENHKYDSICLDYLKDSICELHHRIKDIHILLEPGDRDVEYHHLIGHTDMAISFIKDIRSEVSCIDLLFDISHIAQLDEELYSAWNLAEKYCSHIHLANCVLDRSSLLYGDKHPLFSVKNGVYSHEAAKTFYQYLQNGNLPLTVGIEMICPEVSEQTFFEHFAAETRWFFNYR
ncbi:MAG: sugar phosphate isomerase/epimerase family protein [Ruminiclostridium sp.]